MLTYPGEWQITLSSHFIGYAYCNPLKTKKPDDNRRVHTESPDKDENDVNQMLSPNSSLTEGDFEAAY